MRNAGLEEAQAGIKIASRNISNVRYADDTTLIAEKEVCLRSHRQKVMALVFELCLVFHLFQNFPQFLVIHTVKGFGTVNKAEVDIFLELSCFFDDPTDISMIQQISHTKKLQTNIIDEHRSKNGQPNANNLYPTIQ